MPTSLRAYHLPIAPFSKKERVLIMENLALLTSAGMSVTASLKALVAQLQTKSLRQAVERVVERIEVGSALWRAFDAEYGLFSPQVISLIRIGEETGKLSDNLKIIAEQQQKELEFRSKIRSAMMYPVFVLGLTGVMGVGIAWFILPRLAKVFAELTIELPLITKILIAVGEFLNDYGLIAVPLGVLGVGIIFCVVFVLPQTKHMGQEILFRIPGTKTLLQEVELARAGYLLGTLLSAGVPVLTAIDSLRRASIYRRYERLYEALGHDIESGHTLEESIGTFKNSAKLVPLPIQQLLGAGERSGALAETLLRIGKNYDTKTETTMKNLSVILEPVLLVIVWVGVVSVALAVIFPIYSLIGGLNQATSTEEPPVQPPVGIPATNTEVPLPPEEQTTAPDNAAQPNEEVVDNEAPENTRMVVIGSTETGYLNVRAAPSFDGVIVGQVMPGEQFPLLEEDTGWLKIKLASGEGGWIFGTYAEIIEKDTPIEEVE